VNTVVGLADADAPDIADTLSRLLAEKPQS
jgi:hypothetical protein